MRKLIFSINVTLDGFIDHTAGIADEELHQYFTALLNTADLLLYGRKTYQLLAEYWPTAPSDPEILPGGLEYANTLNPMPKLVYSRTLENVGWNTQVIKEVNAAEIVRLKQQPGKNILLGGSDLASTFMQLGLIDEYRFLVHPIVLGRGEPLLKGLKDKAQLKLVNTRTLKSGVVALVYEPQRG